MNQKKKFKKWIHQVVLCPIFRGMAKLIFRLVVPACKANSSGGVFLFLHIDTILLSPEFLVLTFLTCMGGDLRFILICIYLMKMTLKTSVSAVQPFGILQLRIIFQLSTPFLIGLLDLWNVTSSLTCLYWIVIFYLIQDWLRYFPLLLVAILYY